MDLGEIIQAIRTGHLDSQSLIRIYLARIADTNAKVKAVGSLNPDAEALALEKDTQQKAGIVLGDLHGVPIIVKDTLVTNDKMDTTGGSFALVGAKFRTPSTTIKRLQDAGAIILGKANLSQWGMARSGNCPNGWSALHGQALGAFHENQDPQGSSSGCAIAASLNLASATIGGETCGSILYPAQRNGVVGLKPTVGLTSRAGTIPLNPEHDSIGPLTRFVKDSARILQVIAGRDELDPATWDIPFASIPDYVGACSLAGCQGLRIVLPTSVRKVIRSDPEIDRAFQTAVETLRSLGAIIVEDVDFEKWKPGGRQREDLMGDILLRESYKEFFSDLEVNPHGIHDLADLIEFIKRTPEEAYAEFGAGWFESARDASGTSSSEAFLSCKSRMEELGSDLVKLLDRTNCDILLATGSTDLPLDLGRLPGISVPLGYWSEARDATIGEDGTVTKGPNMPFSVVFAGRRFSEEKLLGCAYAFEQATLAINDGPGKMQVRPVADVNLPFSQSERL
ncbi:amidase [Cercophora samala]|uniref:Amidase n=1 Tax=Cercophora samala TaxID=330535 RepID=A0AA40D9L9_9PEZI|nr:amidase [Cercophora samala]